MSRDDEQLEDFGLTLKIGPEAAAFRISNTELRAALAGVELAKRGLYKAFGDLPPAIRARWRLRLVIERVPPGEDDASDSEEAP